jgi:hypothetical protein
VPGDANTELSFAQQYKEPAFVRVEPHMQSTVFTFSQLTYLQEGLPPAHREFAMVVIEEGLVVKGDMSYIGGSGVMLKQVAR